MKMCNYDPVDVIRLSGWIFFALGLVPLLLPKPVLQFYSRINESLGRHANLNNPLWTPMAFRVYGILTCVGGIYLLRQ